jgi:DNA replication and repair protein RecF
MVHRAKQVALLAAEAARVHEGLSGGRETLAVKYEPSVRCPLEPEDEVAEAVAERLIARLDESIRRGVTPLGPHRDDLDVTLDGREARTYGSQGQQRTAALSLKIAELRVVAQAIGEPPLLLLDDVLSELDPLRRAAVMALVDEADQVLVTCADPDLFHSERRATAQVWHVRAGHVSLWAEANP